MTAETETTIYKDLLPETTNDFGYEDGANSGDGVSTNWAVTVLLLAVFSIGMIGNLLVMFVIVILGEYKKVMTHWYILQLTIADTIFLLTIPLRVTEDIYGGASLPQWVCQVRETMFFLNYYASISFLVLMTVDRYIAICRRFSSRLRKLRKRSVVYFNTIVVWIVSLAICVPVVLYSSKVGFAPNCKCELYASAPVTAEGICEKSGLTATSIPPIGECIEKLSHNHSRKCWDSKVIMGIDLTTIAKISKCDYRDRSKAFNILLFFNIIAMFVLPLLVMSVCYTLIALQLKRTKVNQDYHETPVVKSPVRSPLEKRKRAKSIATIKDNRNRNRVTTMCVCLVVLFFLCWFPFHAVHLAKLKGIEAEDEYCEHLFHVAFIIAYLSVSSHSILNPCIYNFIGSKSENRLRTATSSVNSFIRRRSRSSSITNSSINWSR